MSLPGPITPTIRFDWDRYASNLATATTVRLHPRVGTSSAEASKMGGPIAWPVDEPWPLCIEHSAPLVPTLQLNAADVPEVPWPEGATRLQLLLCPRDHDDDDYGPKVSAWWRAQSDGPWTTTPTALGEDVEDDYVTRPCVLAPERVTERPSEHELDATQVISLETKISSLADEQLRQLCIADRQGLYFYHFSVAPGTKAGGFVDWIQDPQVPSCRACDRRMVHLVTIASAEFDGTYQRWMPLAERGVLAQGYEERAAVQSAAGLMLGDMGSVYVFTCAACDDRPIATVLQCS